MRRVLTKIFEIFQKVPKKWFYLGLGVVVLGLAISIGLVGFNNPLTGLAKTEFDHYQGPSAKVYEEASAGLKYKIIYEDTLIRFDECKTYFVLIDPVNLKNDHFKKGIMETVRLLAKQKGRQITIEFFDDRKVMQKYIKIRQVHFTGDPPEPQTVKEVRHHIARFEDYIGMGTWLSFYPTLNGNNNDYNLFGKYHDFFTFNPYE